MQAWLRPKLRKAWDSFRAQLADERKSLRGRLMYALLGLLVVLLLLEGHNYFLQIQGRREMIASAERHTAEALAGSFRSVLDQLYRAQAAAAATVTGGRFTAGPEQMSGILQDVRDQYPGLLSVQVIGMDGRVRCASPWEGPRDVRREPFYAVVSRGSRYFSNVLPRPDGPCIQIASPVSIRTGSPAPVRPVGSIPTVEQLQARVFVVMEFSAEALGGMVFENDENELVVLVDRQGRVAAGSRPLAPADAALVSARLAAAARIPRGRASNIELPSSGLHAGFAVPDRETGWTVAYLRPVKDTMAEVNQNAGRAVLALTLVVVVLGAAMVIVVHVSLRPLVRLSAGARRLGSGDLAFRLPPPEVQEFGLLVSAMNSMAERLQTARGELVGANRALEERVRERTRELEQEHEKLLRAERLSTLGLLSSAIAHDLRNPLNTVGLCVYWLRMRLGPARDEDVQARLATIERELKRSSDIIQTLLAFARTGAPDRQPTDLNELMENVAEVIQPPENVSLELQLSPELPPTPVDRAQLFQVTENLIRNAIQAMPEGGTVRVTTAGNCETVRLSVSDTGPGIPADVRERVFEPLVTTRTTGTGLGLALCKRIVDAHGGRISVESAPGEGAVFLVQLPTGTSN